MNEITYISIFYVSLYTSSISFGGGYLVLPLLKEEYHNKRKLISKERLDQIASIAQSSPGAIAINLSAGIAYDLKGMKGLIIAVLGSVIPPFLIIVLISKLPSNLFSSPIMREIFRGLDLAVISIMISLNFSMIKDTVKEEGYLTLIFTLLVTFLTWLLNLSLTIVLFVIFIFVKFKKIIGDLNNDL